MTKVMQFRSEIIFFPSNSMTSIFTRFANWSLHPNKKRIFNFEDGTSADAMLLGSKGSGLCDLVRLKIPVPPGFILTTETSLEFYKSSQNDKLETMHHIHSLPDQLINEYKASIFDLEICTGRKFGVSLDDAVDFKGSKDKPFATASVPLLLSVRSDAACPVHRTSDTILNVGMNDQVVASMITVSNERFALDCYRRFLQMFANVVNGVDNKLFEDIINASLTKNGVQFDYDLSGEALREVVRKFKELADVPEDPWEQLQLIIANYYTKWFSNESKSKRQFHDEKSSNAGVAIIIQSMVYGNLNHSSGAGVCYTRNPTTGAKEVTGEYLGRSEGDELISSSRATYSLAAMRSHKPEVYDALIRYTNTLENHYKDMQSIHFTIENRRLYILKSSRGSRSAKASIKVAVDLVREGILTSREALLRVHPKEMSYFVKESIDASQVRSFSILKIGKGSSACEGSATGMVSFDNNQAIKWSREGRSVILCKEEFVESDVDAIQACNGIIAMRGGLSSQASLLARHLGKPAVVGAGVCVCGLGEFPKSNGQLGCPQPCECCMDIIIDKSTLKCFDHSMMFAGDVITVDGSSGNIFRGYIPTTTDSENEDFRALLLWASEHKNLGIFVSADSKESISLGLSLGAEGVGLWMTEGTFQLPDRVDLFRTMLLSPSPEFKTDALSKLLQLNEATNLELFRILHGRQITMRLLDPPISSFFPAFNGDMDIHSLASKLELDPQSCKERITSLRNLKQASGLRGPRILLLVPELAEMQVKAILGAACMASMEGVNVKVEILLPWVSCDHEAHELISMIRSTAEVVFQDKGTRVEYRVGCMLEAPRSCMRVTEIVGTQTVDFISISTDDLTAMVYGFSKNDSKQFMGQYLDSHVMEADPFVRIDESGVGSLIRTAVQRCRHASPGSTIGVCGNHTSDPTSISFFDSIGVHYISCEPKQIPCAMVAAAQSHIRSTAKEGKHWQHIAGFGRMLG